ncbi:MAG TPA: ABC transporter permease [Candidatus Limnocylindrales bacterium]|nr:ABC transporter permease [Candidatus Limnocylindrales bacterium]
MSRLDGLRHRVHVLVHRSQYAAELAEERRFHREMEQAEGRGGEGPDSEAYEAVRAPRGGGGGWRGRLSALADRLAQDLEYALRGLARSPGFTAVAVLTLALGVGANAAVFSLLDRLFSQPPPGVAEPEPLRRLYVRIANHPLEPGMIFPSFSYSAFSAVEGTEGDAYDAIAWIPSQEETLRDGDRQVPVRTSFVSHDYFSVLGVGAARGRLFGEDEVRVDVPAPVAVIGHSLWDRAFGSTRP